MVEAVQGKLLALGTWSHESYVFLVDLALTKSADGAKTNQMLRNVITVYNIAKYGNTLWVSKPLPSLELRREK